MRNIKAIQTEYNGTVFKSKSEAIFARSIDLFKDHDAVSSRWSIEVMYEPDLEIFDDGYKSDFLIKYKCNCCDTVRFDVIEYKPKRPTDTYIRKFASRANKLFDYYWRFAEVYSDKSGVSMDNIMVYLLIVYGSPFNDEVVNTMVCCEEHDALHDLSESCKLHLFVPDYKFIKHFFDEAKSYRFDLING